MTSTADPQSETGLKESFFRHFQQESSALQEKISQLNKTTQQPGERNEAVDVCLAGIERLNHEVKDAASFIPAYDRRTYADAIKSLSDALQTARAAFAPPKKFQFKSARRTQQPAPTPASTTSTSTTPSTTNAAPAAPSTTLPAPSPTEPTTSLPSPTKNVLTISHHTHTRIILPSPSPSSPSPTQSSPPSPPSGSITHLTHTLLSLPTFPLATLTLKSISRSLLYIPRISGPLHITDLHDCVLLTACHQFRMHACTNVNVYLHCASRPIVEDVRGVRFAPLPASLQPPELQNVQNRWNQIDDFGWLKSEPSPHFRLLGVEERIPDEQWTGVPGESDGSTDTERSVDEILKSVGIA